MTRDEFIRLMESPEYSDRRCELFGGQVIEKTPTMGRSFILTACARMFGNFLDTRKLPGYGLISPHLKLSNDENMPLIDYCAVLQPLSNVDDYLDTCPEIIVESEYPGQSASLLHKKAQYYIAHGAEIVVDVYRKRIVEVYTRTDHQILLAKDVLKCDPVLPGFSVEVASLFPKT